MHYREQKITINIHFQDMVLEDNWTLQLLEADSSTYRKEKKRRTEK